MEKAMDELKHILTDLNAGQVKEGEPLKRHTTWKIGGPAALFFEPESTEGLLEGLEHIQHKGIPWFVLGKGSNILVSDKGIQGVVIKLGDRLASVKQEKNIITVEAGCSLIKLATVMSKKGYSGLEFAGGIPGTVGGAVFMNAGAHRKDISDILTEAYILYPDGKTEWVKNEDMAYSYRTSALQSNGGICLAARFKLEKGKTEVIRDELQKNKSYRKDTQPWKDPCCGSVFRNPLPDHAGQLIESAGLKGYSVGGAKVSEKHANFIVNTGDATAENVKGLINIIKSEVNKKFGIQLITEVEYIGDSPDDTFN